MPDQSETNVIPLHPDSRRGAAQRRAAQRGEASRRHPSLLWQPHGRASAEQIAVVVPEIGQLRHAAGGGEANETPNGLVRRIAAVAEFVRRRLTGDYRVDEFGFDPHLHDGLIVPMLRNLFKLWCQVEVDGIEHLPKNGAALVVGNHTDVLPFDGLMCSVVVHNRHPEHRPLRLLAADTVFGAPIVGQAARKAGATRACTTNAQRLLARGELTAVFPMGYEGRGRSVRDRYKVQRFGRGGFVSAALRTKSPIIPCSIVGSGELYPMIADAKLLARLIGLPNFPITQRFALAGRVGLITLPSKLYIEFGAPIRTTEYDETAADDRGVTLALTDQLREIIQHTVYRSLGERRTSPHG